MRAAGTMAMQEACAWKNAHQGHGRVASASRRLWGGRPRPPLRISEPPPVILR